MPKRIETFEEFYDRMRTQLQIDRNDLDSMWIGQPQIFQVVGERLALEISYRDEAKDALKDLTAELDSAVREEDNERIERDGGKKMTETAIANQIREDKEFKKATLAVNEKNRAVNLLSTLKESYQMRRYALQDLTALHISGYSMQTASVPARDRQRDSTRRDMNALRKRREEED